MSATSLATNHLFKVTNYTIHHGLMSKCSRLSSLCCVSYVNGHVRNSEAIDVTEATSKVRILKVKIRKRKRFSLFVWAHYMPRASERVRTDASVVQKISVRFMGCSRFSRSSKYI